MKAIDLHEHMKKTGTWVDWSATCDGFKAGDPETEVKGIAVAWQSTTGALKKAHEMGCNFFITHEPTFYAHMDDDSSVFRHPHIAAKREFLRQTGMVVYRCHDVWDVMPRIGILDSWATGLGFTGEPISGRKYYLVYETEERTLGELAKRVAAKTKPLGQPAVEVVGDLDTPISKVGLGTGAIANVQVMSDMGADVYIVTDDSMMYWWTGCWSKDSGIPMVICHHNIAEEWGIIHLASYLRETFPEVGVTHIPQGCAYTLIG